MAKVLPARPATATFLSCSAFILTVLAAAPDAGAEPLAGAPQQSGLEGRHSIGMQLGGTGLLQAVYRYRAVGPLHLEVGALGADHAANMSASVLFGVPIAGRWLPYAAFGGSLMWAFGPKTPDGCDPMTTGCPTVTDSDSWMVLHARAGVGVAFGATRRHLLSIDFGGWRGTHAANRTDAAGVVTHSSAAVLQPMAGLSYFFAL